MHLYLVYDLINLKEIDKLKKLVVNNNNCIGCGACVGIDPEHFSFNDEGLSHPISQENLESQSLQDAMASCPVAVISVEEDDEEEKAE